jgi:hypothetical protein
MKPMIAEGRAAAECQLAPLILPPWLPLSAHLNRGRHVQFRIVTGRGLQTSRWKSAAVHFLNCFSLASKLQHPNVVSGHEKL